MSSTCHAALTVWLLGYPALAARRMEEALALARALEHPFTSAHASRFAAAFHLSRGERDAVREQVDATFGLLAEHGLKSFLAVGNFHRGWLLAGEGREEEGLTLMREWVQVCRDIRADCLVPTYMGWLAEAYGKAGQPAEGLALVGEALAVAKESGYEYWTAELYRLKGTLTLASSSKAAWFHDAIATARRQGAKSLELRATMSLTRLLARQGKTKAAQALLAEVYGWFTEGFDTADLSEAKGLLEDLGRGIVGRPSIG